VHTYSLDWCSTIVEAYRQTCPRAYEKSLKFCHINEEMLVGILSGDHERWEKFKGIAKQCRHFPNCDPMDYLGAALLDAATPQGRSRTGNSRPGKDLRGA